eukprot:jgi/Chlat1/5814/Chrsp4S09081
MTCMLTRGILPLCMRDVRHRDGRQGHWDCDSGSRPSLGQMDIPHAEQQMLRVSVPPTLASLMKDDMR